MKAWLLLRVLIVAALAELTWPSFGLVGVAHADTYWPAHDAWVIRHDVRNRWNEAPAWCDSKPVTDELGKQMHDTQRIVIAKHKITLVTAKDARTSTNDTLINGNQSYGFWRVSKGRTLAILIECNSPTVCVLYAHLIIRDGDATCIERINTVVYKGDKPPANLPKIDVYATPHAQSLP